ncbi:hypothetical protein PC39_12546 [Salinisphaera sp. PC39]|uniref:hypothetical protein n=1 Tax=Salinisphaera sp. PC39 TaxID=1304156 RepID=UPI00333F5DA4
MRLFWALALPLAVAACANEPACMKDQPYQTAESFPPLRAPAGMSVPEPDPNMRVPEVGDGPVAAYPAEQGEGEEDKEAARRRCLSSPPPLPENRDS